MTENLPLLNVKCYYLPQGGKCTGVGKCGGCENRDVILAHAVAYNSLIKSKKFQNSGFMSPKYQRTKAKAARDAVLALAGAKTIKELEAGK